MLPVHRKLREEVDATLKEFIMERASFHEGAVAEVPHYTIHEGHENSIIREDGSEDVTEMVTIENEVKKLNGKMRLI